MNLLLERVSQRASKSLTNISTPVFLPAHFPLFVANQVPEYAYLLSTGFAYVTVPLADDIAVSVAPLGRASISGIMHLLGPASVPNDARMLIEGEALRARMSDLLDLIRTDDEIRSRILELIQVEELVARQFAACHLAHEAEARFASALLTLQDHAPDGSFSLTQDDIARIVGARRTTITGVAKELQKAGIIAYSRGKVKSINREALQELACECQTAVHALWSGLYSQPIPEWTIAGRL